MPTPEERLEKMPSDKIVSFEPFQERVENNPPWHGPALPAYNAEMGSSTQRQTGKIDAWLRNGGTVVTASDRAARAVTAAYHHARRAEGLSAWSAPHVLGAAAFARAAWDERRRDGRLLLNPVQEQRIWAEIIGQGPHPAALLDGPRQRLAQLAMEAHELLCNFAPHYLQEKARNGWQQDAEAFSGWLAEFDRICRAENLLSASRLPLEVVALLQSATKPRPPLLLAGFDRLLPAQKAFFDAWGAWSEVDRGEPASNIRFYAASDFPSELTACALWAARELAANPTARLLVITQDAAKRRGEIERAFLQSAGPEFEFSLGVPLGGIALARSAQLALRWLAGALQEQQIDWLFSAGKLTADEKENRALQSYMRALRQRGLAQPQWTLESFLNQPRVKDAPPRTWAERMVTVQQLLEAPQRRTQTPLEWAELVPRLLEAMGWPGWRPLASEEFQALNRWQQTLELCGTLGFDGRRIAWQDFLSSLARQLDETLFTPESRNAPVQITGPAESAGLDADGLWFLGASEEAWPAPGSLHPLLPVAVQREAKMPHATAQLDWELARAVTARIAASAGEIHCSFARQNDSAEARPSRLIEEIAGSAQPFPNDWIATSALQPAAEFLEDNSRIAYPHAKAEGGAQVLTTQSLCPFQAFAITRLGAKGWNAAEAGLSAQERGNLLHAVMHLVWSGPPDGIASLQELLALGDIEDFVQKHVRKIFREKITTGMRKRMPRRYLELEELRLTRLIAEWLSYEAGRAPFEVAEIELKHTLSVSGLALDLRLDRVDRLNDGSLLVVDYKTGQVSPKVWELPRPEDLQLPLYACFALGENNLLGGLVFAKLRAGENEFAGRVGDPATTLLPGLKAASGLVKSKLEAEQIIAWREQIQLLARDFLSGDAAVDPREPLQKTCDRCRLQTLCRISESGAVRDKEDESDEEEYD